MPITVAMVESYTKGRLPAADAETANILARAYGVVRTYCEWHVTPIKANHVVTLDGRGGRALSLHTQKLVTLHSLTEDGRAHDLARLSPTVTKPVLLYKDWGGCWTTRPSGIVVTMTHGYDDDTSDLDNPDVDAVRAFETAVLDACDRFSMMVGTGAVNGLKRYDVDDIKREWFDPSKSGGEVQSATINERLCEPFRLLEPV